MHKLFWVALIIGGTSQSACTRTETVEGFPEEFAGVGIELKIDKNRPTVVRSLPGGPASQAGVQPGDRIMAVDETDTEGLSLGDVVVRLRGKPGSQVVLTLDRSGQRILLVVQRHTMHKRGDDYGAQ